jgi:RNA polymerase sigma-54 factor
VPTVELETRIEQELEDNPALEEGQDLDDNPVDDYEDLFNNNEEDTPTGDERTEGIDVQEYLRDDDIAGYKMQGDGPGFEEEREAIQAEGTTLNDQLIQQLGYLRLDDLRYQIGLQIIGSIDEDGYLRRELSSVANDLAFSQSLLITPQQVEEVLLMIHQFDPPGIAARNLQECLLLQLERRPGAPAVNDLALRIIEDCFDEFTRKHYDKIQRKLDVEDYDELKEAIRLITHLNPKPGESGLSGGAAPHVLPDFLVTQVAGKLDLTLNSRNAPELRVSRQYAEMLDTYAKSDKKSRVARDTVTFVKQKLDSARWFIDALKQRQQTLLKVMEAILQFQYDFFLEGDEARLHPMILKDIADVVEMDISTVSRVANSKYVQTEFGVFPLKFFFSEGIQNDAGEDVSTREVKQVLRLMIEAEDKAHPLSDEKLEELLAEKGFPIARRTVAKYREQLNLPVARLRKEM